VSAEGLGVPLRGSAAPLTDRYDVALLDLDGVVYVGPDAVPGAPAALAEARRRDMRLAFVTNNAARTPQTVAAHLARIGVSASPADVVTSAQAAAHVVADLVPAGSAVLVVGGAGLEAALRERGLLPVWSADDAPVAVVQGFAPEVGWRSLTEGALAVGRGVPWVLSNQDRTLPVPRGRAPGNGALAEVIRVATGRAPVAVAGKPELPMHRECIARTGARTPLVVGDRLDTDIEGAVRGGTDSLLVFSGVATPAEVVGAPPGRRPTYLAGDVGGLLVAHPEVTLDADASWRCGGWRAGVSDGRLLVHGEGDPYDGLRAVCAAAWAPPAPPAGGFRVPERLGLLLRTEHG
jgi:HAD superfamily hydrolase (TIGR01450 family)